MSLEKYKLSSLKNKHNEQEKQQELDRALTNIEKSRPKVEDKQPKKRKK